MTPTLHFTASIVNITYQPTLGAPLSVSDFKDFDINDAAASGLLSIEDKRVAYSKWGTPKRTRTYPFERVYNTLKKASQVLTVIPVVTDEGYNGNFDKIQYSTISLMNLLDVYIVLGYYESAERNMLTKHRDKEKLTNQRLASDFVNEQIEEIAHSGLSAPDWNRKLFEERFTETAVRAVNAYKAISKKQGVVTRSYENLMVYLGKIKTEYEQFKRMSLEDSRRAVQRELATLHKSESLGEGAKASFLIEDHLGGVFHLTADEGFLEGDKYIIQESKNSGEKQLPALADIKDGLLKLILYSNLNTLHLEGEQVKYSTRLKLTGKVKGYLKLPARREEIDSFFRQNTLGLKSAHKMLIERLQDEVSANRNLEIVIKSNT